MLNLSQNPYCNILCKTCNHKNLSYLESINQKYNFAVYKLDEFAEIEPIITPDFDKILNYREKILLKSEFDPLLGWKIGTIRNKQVVDIDTCPIHKNFINQTISLLKSKLPNPESFPLAFYAQNGKQLILVLKTNQSPNLSWIDEKLIDKLKSLGIEALWLHLNPSTGKKVFNKTYWKLVFGNKISQDSENHYYGHLSFSQLLPKLVEKANSSTIDFFNPKLNDIFIDLYCGTGKMSLKMSKKTLLSIGIEISGNAIDCAILNSPKTIFLRGTSTQRIPQIKALIEDHKKNNSQILLYLNPPRTGIGEELINQIFNKINPDKIAYLSCSQGTLSKDLKYFKSLNYVVKRIQNFDFFPFTKHFETLVFITKKY